MVRLRWILLPVLVACLYKVMSPEGSIWADDDALFLGSAPSHQVRCKRNLHSYSYAIADVLDVDDSVGSPVFGYGLLDDRDMYSNLYAGAYGKEAESINDEHLPSSSNGVSQSDVVGVPEGGVIPSNNGVSQSDVVGVPEGGVIPPNNGVSTNETSDVVGVPEGDVIPPNNGVSTNETSDVVGVPEGGVIPPNNGVSTNETSDVVGVPEGDVIPPNNGVSQSDVAGVPEGGVIPPNNGVSTNETSDVVGVPEGGVIPPNNGVSQSDVAGVPEGGVIPPNNGVSQSDVAGVPEGSVIPPNNGVSTNEASDVVGVPEGGVISPNNEVPADNSTSPSGTSPTEQDTSGAGGEKVKCDDDSSTFSEDASCGITRASNLGTSNSNSDVEQAANAVTAQTNALGENQGNDRQNGETSELNTQTTEGGIGDNIAGGESPNMVADGGKSTDENQQTGSVNEATGGTDTNREVNGESTVDGVTGEQTAQSVSDVAGATSADKPGVVDNIQGAELVPTEGRPTTVDGVTGEQTAQSVSDVAGATSADKPGVVDNIQGAELVPTEGRPTTVDGVTGEQTAQSVSDVAGATSADKPGVVDNIQGAELVPTEDRPTTVDGVTGEQTAQSVSDVAGATSADKPGVVDNIQGAEVVPTEAGSTGVIGELNNLEQKPNNKSAVDTGLENNARGTEIAVKAEQSNADVDQLSNNPSQIETTSGTSEVNNEETNRGLNKDIEDGVERKDGDSTVGETISGTAGGSGVLDETQPDPATSQRGVTGNAPTANEGQTDDIAGTTGISGVQAADSIGVGSLKQDAGEEQARETLGANEGNVVQAEAVETKSAGTDQLPSENDGKETDPSEAVGAKVEDGSPSVSASEQTETPRGEQVQGEGIKTVGLNEAEEANKVDDRAGNVALPVNNETGEQQSTGAEITSVGPQQSVTGGDTTGDQQSTGAEITGVNPQQSVTGEQQSTGAEITGVNPQQSVTGGDTTGDQQSTGAEITSVGPQQSVTGGDTTGEQQSTGAEITSVGPQQSVTGGDTTGDQQSTGAEITSVGPQQSVTGGDTTGDQQSTGAEITSVGPQQSVTGGDTTGDQQSTGAEITSVGPQQSVTGGDTTGDQQSTGAEITGVNPQQSVTGEQQSTGAEITGVNPQQSVTGEQQSTGAEITGVNPQQSVTGGDTTGDQQLTGAEVTSVSPQQSVTGGDTTGDQQSTGAEITSVSPQQSVTGGDTTGDQQSTGAEITGVNPQQSVTGGDTTGDQQSTGAEITSVSPQQSVTGGDTTGDQQSTGAEITSVVPQQSVTGGDTTGDQQLTGAEVTSVSPQQSVTGGDTTGDQQSTGAEITSVSPQQSVTGEQQSTGGEITSVVPQQSVTGEQQSTGGEITGVVPQQSVTGGDTTGDQQLTGAEVTSASPQQSVTGGDTTGEQQSASNKNGAVNVGNPEETSLNQMATAVGEAPSEVGNGGIVEVPDEQKDGETNVGNLAQGDQNQTPGSEIVSEGSAGTNGEREKESVSNVNVGNPAESSLNQVPGDSGTVSNLQSEGTLEKGQTADQAKEASGSNNEENAPTRVSLDLPVEDTVGSGKSPETKVGETTNQETGSDQVTTLNNAEEGVGKADGEERSGTKQGGETEVLAQGERNNELEEASQISESSRNTSERTNIETIDENYKESVKEPLEGGSETQMGKEINISSENVEKSGKLMQGGKKEDSVAVPISENSVTGVQQELKEGGNVEKLREDVEIVPVGEKGAPIGGVSGKLVSPGDERLPAELVVILNEYRRRAEANRKTAAAQLINNLNGDAMGPLTGTGAGVECGCAEDMNNNLVNSECGECCGQDDCCGCDEHHYDFAGLPPLCPLCQQEFYSMMVGQHNPYATMPPIDYSRGGMCKRHRNAKQKKNAQLSPYMRKVLRALSYTPNNVYQQEVYKPFAYEKKGRKSAIRGPLPYIIERHFSIYGKTKPIPHKSVKMLYYNQKNGNRPKVFKLDKLQNT